MNSRRFFLSQVADDNIRDMADNVLLSARTLNRHRTRLRALKYLSVWYSVRCRASGSRRGGFAGGGCRRSAGYERRVATSEEHPLIVGGGSGGCGGGGCGTDRNTWWAAASASRSFCYSGPVIPQRAAREPFNFDRVCRVGGDGDDGFMMDGPGERARACLAAAATVGGRKNRDRGAVRGQSIKKKKKTKCKCLYIIIIYANKFYKSLLACVCVCVGKGMLPR